MQEGAHSEMLCTCSTRSPCSRLRQSTEGAIGGFCAVQRDAPVARAVLTWLQGAGLPSRLAGWLAHLASSTSTTSVSSELAPISTVARAGGLIAGKKAE